MSRKHYEAVAKAIRAERQNDDGRGAGAIASLADSMACIFEADSPRFDRDRFLEACGMDADGEWVI